MPCVFDPLATKQALLEVSIPLAYRTTFESLKQQRCLGSWCGSLLKDSIECVLVGLSEHVPELLAKCIQFGRAAEDEKHEGFPTALIEARKFSHLAMATWLNSGKSDGELLSKSIVWMKRYFEVQSFDADAKSFTHYAIDFAIAGAWPELIEIADQCAVVATRSIGKAADEAQVILALANHRLYGEHSEAQVAAAVKRVLDKHVGEWLQSGASVRAVNWLKLAYLGVVDNTISPEQLILRAYRHMQTTSTPIYGHVGLDDGAAQSP